MLKRGLRSFLPRARETEKSVGTGGLVICCRFFPMLGVVPMKVEKASLESAAIGVAYFVAVLVGMSAWVYVLLWMLTKTVLWSLS